MTTTPGMRMRPRPGVPAAAFKEVAPVGARQKNDPTVGFDTPPHGTSGVPATLIALPTPPLSVKHERLLATQI